MEDTQTVVNDSPVDGQVEETTSAETTSAEQTANVDTDKSAETENTESVEDKGGESKEGLENKPVPYFRFKEKVAEVNQLKAELEALRNQAPQQSEPQYMNEEQAQLQQAKKTLDELGYVSKDAVNEIVRNALAEDRVYRELDTKVQQLSKEWDGTNGKPKFVTEEVIEYGNNVGVYDPEAAFKLMHEKELAEYWSKRAKSGLKTERQGKPVQNVGADENALMEEARKSGDFTKVLKLRLGKRG